MKEEMYLLLSTELLLKQYGAKERIDEILMCNILPLVMCHSLNGTDRSV